MQTMLKTNLQLTIICARYQNSIQKKTNCHNLAKKKRKCNKMNN